jgi:hypothetical protein
MFCYLRYLSIPWYDNSDLDSPLGTFSPDEGMMRPLVEALGIPPWTP